ncbi:hypothetical protein FS837_008928 [Tulasnella sp. UAMH 9824]|nr:hypothetical protein FS837_008928 [Tulasnella sp. UAMH 9824]
MKAFKGSRIEEKDGLGTEELNNLPEVSQEGHVHLPQGGHLIEQESSVTPPYAAAESPTSSLALPPPPEPSGGETSATPPPSPLRPLHRLQAHLPQRRRPCYPQFGLFKLSVNLKLPKGGSPNLRSPSPNVASSTPPTFKGSRR